MNYQDIIAHTTKLREGTGFKDNVTIPGTFNVTGAASFASSASVGGVVTFTGAITRNVLQSATHGPGAIGTGTILAPRTYIRTENGAIITTIKIDLTGLKSMNTANDIIGLDTVGPPASYLLKYVVATHGIVHRIEMHCIELPAGGDNDINLVAGSAADEGHDDAVTGAVVLVNGGDWVAGKTVVQEAQAITANYYLYLTAGTGDLDVVYTAGQFIIVLYGHPLLT